MSEKGRSAESKDTKLFCCFNFYESSTEGKVSRSGLFLERGMDLRTFLSEPELWSWWKQGVSS